MATVLDLVKDALVEVGAYSPGESLTADDGAFCLGRANNMRDTWNAEGLMIYEVRQETFTLVVATQSPTIGPSGATFTTTRPVKIEAAEIIDTTNEPNQRWPVEVVNKDRWIERAVADDTGEFPAFVYYEPSYPNGTLHFNVAPTVAHTLELSTQLPWAALTSLSNTLVLPPAYYDCAMYNLALRLANPFGKEPTALLVQMASSSRAVVKKLNRRTPQLRSDVPMGCRW